MTPLPDHLAYVVRYLDERIGELTRARQALLDAFAIEAAAAVGHPANSLEPPVKNAESPAARSTRSVAGGNPRWKRIHDWLETNGPADRNQIAQAIGDEVGLVSAALSQGLGDRFSQPKNGQWAALALEE